MYCDRTCFNLFRGDSIQLILRNIERANVIDKFILVDFPLKSYNAFFSRNVEEKDYIDALEKVIEKKVVIEYKILIAYYNASKQRAETYFPFSMVRSALATTKMFRDISSHVSFDFKMTLSIPERIKIEHDDFINALLERKIIDDETRKKMEDIHDQLGMNRYMLRIGDGVAIAYITGIIAGARIKQDIVESITRRKMVTIRNLSLKIIDKLKNDEKIILNDKFSSNIRNLSLSTIMES